MQCLKQYMQYHKVKAADDLLIGDQRLIQSNIMEYLLSLQQISYGTRYLYATVIRHFYDINDILLNWKKNFGLNAVIKFRLFVKRLLR